MIASLTLTSIARMMNKLLTPDYFTQNTCLFKNNYLHETPTDVQQLIMSSVKNDECKVKKSIEDKEELLQPIDDEPHHVALCKEHTIWIISDLANMDISNEDDYDDKLKYAIKEWSSLPDYDDDDKACKEIIDAVHSYGAFKALTEVDSYINNVHSTEKELYFISYKYILEKFFPFSYEEYLYIKKNDIEIL